MLLPGMGWAQNGSGYHIKVTMPQFANQYLYLGYHFGKTKPITDSVKTNARGEAIFKGKEKLKGGIYLLGYPDKKGYFELLIDKQQNFTVFADTTDIINKMKITGSADNLLFSGYQQFMSKKGKEVQAGREGLARSSTAADSARWRDALKKTDESVQEYRSNIEKNNASSLLAALLRALKEPIVPPAAKHPNGTYDSLFAYQYYKTHYWDGVSFTDERLLRTPIFESKLERYMQQVVMPIPDTMIKEAERLITLAKPNKEMFKFILSKYVEKYINPEYMGQDAVFIHIFEKYISAGQTDWFNEKQRKYIFDRAYFVMANQIGQPAANLELADSSGKIKPLYDIQAPYTIICFWDPSCGHCKEIVPKVDSMMQAKWKKQGVKLYGVLTDGGKEAWLQYLHEHGLKDWTHVYEPDEMKAATYAANKAGFRQLFDIQTTPMLYLLDKDKRIIAKKLTYDQLDNVLQRKLAD
jgi:thiol-disulfide isomerase/thioredoxin